jgi:hypothetical protein
LIRALQTDTMCRSELIGDQRDGVDRHGVRRFDVERHIESEVPVDTLRLGLTLELPQNKDRRWEPFVGSAQSVYRQLPLDGVERSHGRERVPAGVEDSDGGDSGEERRNSILHEHNDDRNSRVISDVSGPKPKDIGRSK